MLSDVKNSFTPIWSLFGRNEKSRILVVLIIQILFGFLDLISLILIGLIASIATLGISGIPAGGMTLQLINILSLEAKDLRDQITILAAVSAGLLVLKSISTLYFSRKIIYFLSRRSAILSTKLIQSYLATDFETINKLPASQVQFSLTNGISAITQGIVFKIVLVIVDTSLLLILMAGLFTAEPLMAILTLIYFSAVAFFLHYLQDTRMRRLGEEYSRLYSDNFSALQEITNTLREIITRNQQINYTKRVYRNRMATADTQAIQGFQSNLSKYVMEVALIVGVIGIATFQWIFNPSSTAAAIVAVFSVASLRIAPAALRLQQNIAMINASYGQAKLTMDLISKLRPLADILFENDLENSQKKFSFTGNISFKSVTFRFADSDQDTLHRLSFEVEEGQHLAIVGQTGIGKSTILDLTVGLLAPTTGTVSISGMNPRQVFKKWPNAVGYVPQQEFLSQGTFRDNLIRGCDPNLVSEEDIKFSLSLSQLDELVVRLPKGLDTEITDGGRNLSGGQRQRIGLARALLVRPKILLLDEATSALDNETQNAVSKALVSLKGDCTVLMIAHRYESIKLCDKVLVIKSADSHELMNVNEFFSLGNKSTKDFI